MAEFAKFTAEGQRPDRLPVTINPLSHDDIAACAGLAAAREGEPVGPRVGTFTRAIDDPAQLLLVARHGEHVVGYGKATCTVLPEEGTAPSGWYLTGVVVEPSARRRGVGDQLTTARSEALQQRGARRVWFFANTRNRASLALHTRRGFREVTRDFTIPGVSFAGGEGVLAQWDAEDEGAQG